MSWILGQIGSKRAELEGRVELLRKELADAYAARAVQLLREAVAHGYKDVAHMKKDPDLNPLRARPDFQQLLADLEQKDRK